MPDEPFGLLGRAYDLLYAEKDYAGETARVLALIENASGRRPRSILELGAGTGGHGLHLATRGIEVIGVESSSEMLARSRPQPGLVLIDGDARDIRIGRTFDAVIALFHVASYQAEERDMAEFFGTAAVHLEPGGTFVFDAWYSPAVFAQGPEERVREVEGDGVAVKRRATAVEDVDRSLVDVHFDLEVQRTADGQIERGREVHRMRHLTGNEVRAFARAAGFEVVHAEGFPGGSAPSRETWGVVFVLRRVD
jgi:SAM-dependent methyltransferase